MYWTNRIDELSQILFDKTALETERQTAKYYKDALIKTERDMGKLYDKIVEEGLGTDRIIDLYRYNRFYELRNNLAAKLETMGLQQTSLFQTKFERMYNGVQTIITKNAPDVISNSFVQEGRAKEIIESVWCADGKHWSQRVWVNTAKLQNAIENHLIDCVIKGKSKSEAIKQLREDFGVGFNAADRLLRTELNYIQNQAAADRYIAAGFNQYEWLTAGDERTCEQCGELDHQVFSFGEREVGVNFPPLHPNDRCTIIPVVGR